MFFADALRELKYSPAYLVLGGPSWTLRDRYVSSGLKKRLVNLE